MLYGLTWSCAVMRSSIPYKSRSTELALGPSGVVDAAEAVAGVRVTELGRALRVCIPTAVTWNTSPRGFVEASAALVTLSATVSGKALVTHWGATGICTGAEKDFCWIPPKYIPQILRTSENAYCCNPVKLQYVQFLHI